MKITRVRGFTYATVVVHSVLLKSGNGLNLHLPKARTECVSYTCLGSTTLSNEIPAVLPERHVELLTKKKNVATRESAEYNLFPPKHGQLGIHLSYESAIEVLKTYKSIHKDLVIPRRYLVPSRKGEI